MPSDRDRPRPTQSLPTTPSPLAAKECFWANAADGGVAAPAGGWVQSRQLGLAAPADQAAGKGRHQQRLGARDPVRQEAPPSHRPRPGAARLTTAAASTQWPAAEDQRRATPSPPSAGASPKPPSLGRGGWVGHWAARRPTPATTPGPAAEDLKAADPGTPTPPPQLSPKGPTPMPMERDHC